MIFCPSHTYFHAVENSDDPIYCSQMERRLWNYHILHTLNNSGNIAKYGPILIVIALGPRF